jgi:hypothetical protein
MNRIRYGCSFTNVMNNEQDQIWLKSYECSEQWTGSDMVKSYECSEQWTGSDMAEVLRMSWTMNRIRYGWSLTNVVNNEQDQIWLKSYECSEQWMQRDFGMVLSPILGGCQLVLFLYQQCFWTILCTFQIIFLIFYASITVFCFR